VSGFIPSCFTTKNFIDFSISAMRSKHPENLTIFDFIKLLVFGNGYKLCPSYNFSSVFPLSYVHQNFSRKRTITL
jgi:hypothetical protein